MGRIIWIICIVLLVVAGIWWWRTYHNGNIYDGSVVRRDAAMSNGTTTLENGQNLGSEAHPTPSRSDEPGTVNGDRYRPTPSDLGTQTTPITEDPYGRQGAYAQTGPYAQQDPYARMGQNMPPGNYLEPRPGKYPTDRRYRTDRQDYGYSPAQPPFPSYPTDTQAPNAPDGARFGGSGAYELYRQGNLTYRVNTRSGSSCVIYATMEEWRKPWVYRHGCRG